jgi:hypothetical protein
VRHFPSPESCWRSISNQTDGPWNESGSNAMPFISDSGVHWPPICSPSETRKVDPIHDPDPPGKSAPTSNRSLPCLRNTSRFRPSTNPETMPNDSPQFHSFRTHRQYTMTVFRKSGVLFQPRVTFGLHTCTLPHWTRKYRASSTNRLTCRYAT